MIQPKFNPLENPALRTIVMKMSELPFDPEGEDTDVAGISDCLEEMFVLLGTEDVGEVLATSVENELITQEQGREFLGTAIWSGQTNGAQLQPTIDHWLEEANDPIRIDLALAQGIFPFPNIEQMSTVLGRVSERFPQYADTCKEIIRRRREQGV